MGVLFAKLTEPDLYHSVSQEALRIIRISGGDTAERVVIPASAPRVEEPSGTYENLTTAKLAAKLGVQTT